MFFSRSSAAVISLPWLDRKSTRLNSSHITISYAVFCLKKKKNHHRMDRFTSARGGARLKPPADENTAHDSQFGLDKGRVNPRQRLAHNGPSSDSNRHTS